MEKTRSSLLCPKGRRTQRGAGGENSLRKQEIFLGKRRNIRTRRYGGTQGCHPRRGQLAGRQDEEKMYTTIMALFGIYFQQRLL